MKELARKGNISINKDEEAGDYLLYYDDIILINNALDLEELSDIKDCISQVTAKRKFLEGVSLCRCSNCNAIVGYFDYTNFCPNCGIKLEGVEE